MREHVQRPFGLSGDIGLTVSGTNTSSTGGSNTAPEAVDAGWRTSGRDLPRSALPRFGQILLALVVVAAMAGALHFFFY